MANKEIAFHCGKCNEVRRETIFYTPDEEIELKGKEVDGKFYTKIWTGVFVFGTTVLLFVWFLVLMLKTFEMKKLDKVLGDPNVQYEDTWYSDADPMKKADAIRIVKPTKGGLIPETEAFLKEIEHLKVNASKDRERSSVDIDNLIKTCEALRVEATKLLKEKEAASGAGKEKGK